MENESAGYLKGNVIHQVERATVTALQVLTIVIVVVATFALYQLFWKYLSSSGLEVGSVGDLLPLMQRAFSGILVVMIGLELLETLRSYFTQHHERIQVIVVVAIIAVGRHVIQIDFEHASGPQLLGLAALLIALIGGYALLRRNLSRIPPPVDTEPRGTAHEGAD